MADLLSPARWLALLVAGGLLAGAWAFQLIGHLVPCEMCHWQRWPHYAALALALLAFATRQTPSISRALTMTAGIAIIVSGAVAVFHAGVEYHWWPGPAHCTGPALGGGDPLRALLAAPVVLCDRAQWTLGPVSLAGFNALFSLAGGIAVLALCARRGR